MEHADPHYSIRILSCEPLITISSCRIDAVHVANLIESLPQAFDRKHGLHILLPTWNVEGRRASQFKEAIESASQKMPGHEFLVISSTEYETYLLGLNAVPALQTHQGIFLNENVWQPPDDSPPAAAHTRRRLPISLLSVKVEK